MTTKDIDTEHPDVAAPAPARPATTFFSLAAVLIAVTAVVIAAWSGWQLLSLQSLPARISGDESQLTELTRRLDMLSEDADKQQRVTENILASLEQGLGMLTDLPLRLEQVEVAVANIPGINQQSRANWLKAEALYYMRIANAQATLAGDAQIAASALQLADDKLHEAGDPSMVNIRAKLSEEIAALNAMPVIDRNGISFRLQSLITLADSWSFRSEAQDSFSPELDEPAPDLDAWDRFVATIKSVLSNIISINETGLPPMTQLGAAERALIVESIKAELQVARLSFASGNTKLFSQSIARSATQVELYFDTDSAAVAAALGTLTDIQAIEMPGEMPDISGSLSLMLTSSNTGQAVKSGALQ